MGPTWVLSAPDGPHIGSMNLAISEMTTRPPQRLIIAHQRRQVTPFRAFLFQFKRELVDTGKCPSCHHFDPNLWRPKKSGMMEWNLNYAIHDYPKKVFLFSHSDISGNSLLSREMASEILVNTSSGNVLTAPSHYLNKHRQWIFVAFI